MIILPVFLLVELHDKGHGLNGEGKYSAAYSALLEANKEADCLGKNDLLRGESRTLCWTVYF